MEPKLRQLTSEEKKAAENSLARLKQEKEYQEYLLKYANLMISDGLFQNYMKGRAEFADKQKQAMDNIDQIEDTIKTLQQHLTEGVPQKKKGA